MISYNIYHIPTNQKTRRISAKYNPIIHKAIFINLNAIHDESISSKCSLKQLQW